MPQPIPHVITPPAALLVRVTPALLVRVTPVTLVMELCAQVSEYIRCDACGLT